MSAARLTANTESKPTTEQTIQMIESRQDATLADKLREVVSDGELSANANTKLFLAQIARIEVMISRGESISSELLKLSWCIDVRELGEVIKSYNGFNDHYESERHSKRSGEW